jgi:CHAD domain-containing protein
VTTSGGQRGSIEGLSPGMPFHEAAAAAIRQRVKSVIGAIKRLDPDVSPGGVKPDQVHQLRVAVRRSSAAVQAFEPCLDSEAASRLKKRLKKLRRAVGEARQCDVTAAVLTHDYHAVHGPEREAMGELLMRIKRRRRTALRRLDRVLARLTVKEIRGARDAALESVRPALTPEGGQATLRTAARAAIRRFTGEVRDAGRGPLEDANALHEIRLAGKRLRYAAEVFDCCFDRGHVEEAQSQIVALQDRLGAANDLFEIAGFVEAELEAAPKVPLIARGATAGGGGPDLAPALAHYRMRLRESMIEFAGWWRAGGGERICAAFEALAGDDDAAAIADAVADGAEEARPLANGPLRPRFPGPEEVFGEPFVLGGHAAANGSH